MRTAQAPGSQRYQGRAPDRAGADLQALSRPRSRSVPTGCGAAWVQRYLPTSPIGSDKAYQVSESIGEFGVDGSIYSPGAGHRPPLLAGRETELQRWDLMVAETAQRGRFAARDMLLTGPRGVGKTVMMSQFASLAQRQGFVVVPLQAVRGHSDLMNGIVRRVVGEAEASEGPWRRARAAFDAMTGFSLGPLSVTRQAGAAPASPRSVDPGEVARALAGLADEVRKDEPHGGVMLCVDEIQVVSAPDVALLSAVLQRLNVEHPDAAVVFASTGLSYSMSHLHKAGVTHPERLYTEERLPSQLPVQAARAAIVAPALDHGVSWDPAAVDDLLVLTNRYPAHLQLFADEAWRSAPGPDIITRADLSMNAPAVLDRLEQQTFSPRWEELSDRAREYLTVVAVIEHERGHATTGEVAGVLRRATSSLSDIRASLITEGDLYAPRYNQIALATPLFGEFARRVYDPNDITSTNMATPLRTLEDMVTATAAFPSPAPLMRPTQHNAQEGSAGTSARAAFEAGGSAVAHALARLQHSEQPSSDDQDRPHHSRGPTIR